MTYRVEYSTSAYTDPAVRPARTKFLAEIPIETFRAISRELPDVPDWARYYVHQKPSGWPQRMYEVVRKHLNDRL